MSEDKSGSQKKEHQEIPSLPHLNLNKVSKNYKKQTSKRRLGYFSSDRDHTKFYRKQVTKLNKIESSFGEDTKKYSKYFEPKLIFQIKTDPTKPIIEEKFREDLKESGIEIVSSSSSRNGEWLGYVKDPSFTKLKSNLKDRVVNERSTFVDAFEDISKIPKKEKIGSSLLNRPFQDNEIANLDVEIQQIENENKEEFTKFLHGFRSFIVEEKGNVTDEAINDNFCILRIKADNNLFEKILSIDRIVSINRAPIIEFKKRKIDETKELPKVLEPPKDAHGILILDSGIVKHPVLEPAIDDIFAISSEHSRHIKNTNPYDDDGHGTFVSSVALFGDIEKCKNESSFQPQVKISSSKILYKDKDGWPTFDENELLENQLKRSIERIISTSPKCKIINCSIGNPEKSIYDAKNQFLLATEIDILSNKYKDLIFVISAGNNYQPILPSQYPEHLLENNKSVRVIDPGTAAHALTVGALRNYDNDNELNYGKEYPAQYTRIGPGFKDMIKPELVDFGGDDKHDIYGADFQWIPNARYFTIDYGTSVSAPKISHYLALLYNRFPNSSRNLIKALLLSSSQVPIEKPSPLPNIKKSSKQNDWKTILNIYGYGKPNLENALFSSEHRVVLKHDGEIGLDQVRYFPINLPKNFFTIKGKKEIEVTLVYDPPVNRNHTSYTGNFVDFHLFKNKTADYIANTYSIPEDNNDQVPVPEELSNYEIELKPGTRLRAKGVHLKGHTSFTGKTKINLKDPLVLAIVCKDRWIKDESFTQPFAVVVTIKHQNYNNLYTEIRTRNVTEITERVAEEIQPRVRVRG
jgi:subtilisin family serine protease